MIRSVLAALRREWSLALAVLVALVLRVEQLGGQILVGDEWHALEKAASAGYGEIVTTFGIADHSIPIALYYRAVADAFGLGEPWIRAPFRWRAWRRSSGSPWRRGVHVERGSSEVFGWLLAVSPVLVFYSRFARPYALTCLLALAALLLFHAWWSSRKRAQALLYAPAAVGLVRLARAAPDVTALFVTTGALQAGAVCLLSPAHRNDVFAYARHVLSSCRLCSWPWPAGSARSWRGFPRRAGRWRARCSAPC